MANVGPDKVRQTWARVVSAAVEPLERYPFYVACTTLYWLWTGLAFQGPAFYTTRAQATAIVPAWWIPMVFYALSFVGIGLFFRQANKLARTNAWLVALAVAMTAGVGLCLVWAYVPMSPPELGFAFYCVGTLLVSFGAANFLTAGSRFYGLVGPRVALAVCIEGMLFSAALMAVFSAVPRIVCQVFLLILPTLYVVCLTRAFRTTPRNKLYDHGLQTTLSTPKKLLVSAVLHGLPFGFMLVLLSAERGENSILVFNAVCFAIGALLLSAVLLNGRFDFNQLIYMFGFPMMSLGLLFVTVFVGDVLVGCVVLTVGYTFVHLVMCGVNSYLVKQFEIPMPWILSWTTCCFMLGQAAGSAIAALATRAEIPLYAVAACILFVLLVSSVFMVDNRNMKYGWGVVKPSSEHPAPDAVEAACTWLSHEVQLTERESQILLHLARGRSRRSIGEQLGISEQTVKSHAHTLYNKLGVHTKEELFDLVQDRAQRYGD